jgi:hypothetical protein
VVAVRAGGNVKVDVGTTASEGTVVAAGMQETKMAVISETITSNIFFICTLMCGIAYIQIISKIV